MTNLVSTEAEEAVLGFLFNVSYSLEDKVFVFALLAPDNFASEKNAYMFDRITASQAYDKIMFWEHLQMLPKTQSLGIEWRDIEYIDDFVTKEDAESYVQVVLDKYQRRQIYHFGESLKDSMVKGEDQFEVALRNNRWKPCGLVAIFLKCLLINTIHLLHRKY